MVREIKFRAWNKDKKVFGFFELKNFFMSGREGYGRGEVEPTINTWRYQRGALGDWGEYFSFEIENDEVEDYNFQQFTGLKDKNGKEIYEGDIMRDEKGKISIVDDPILGDWVYLEYHECGQMNTDKMQIVGNIYENPELPK